VGNHTGHPVALQNVDAREDINVENMDKIQGMVLLKKKRKRRKKKRISLFADAIP